MLSRTRLMNSIIQFRPLMFLARDPRSVSSLLPLSSKSVRVLLPPDSVLRDVHITLRRAKVSAMSAQLTLYTKNTVRMVLTVAGAFSRLIRFHF